MTYRPDSPSERQLAYIGSLVSERRETIEAMPEEERNALLAQPRTKYDASRLINRLLGEVRPGLSDAQTARADDLRNASGVLTGRDRMTALDLLRCLESRGNLTDPQWSLVSILVERATTPPAPPVEVGLYLVGDDIVKVYLTQNQRLATKVLRPRGNGKGEFVYSPGWLSKVRSEQRLTEDQAREFGRQHGFCCACARSLDDDRSLAVGYGPVCASHYGWHYPTADEASRILNRPTTV